MKLLIATFNQGKLNDYKTFCKNLKIEVVNLNDLQITAEFDEIFDTFEANAKAKAEFYSKLSGLPTLADDSGIEIPFYNMEPGVKTKRWAGNTVTDQEYFDFIVKKISDIPKHLRQGQMRAVLALCINGQTYLSEGTIKGIFTEQKYNKSTTSGYPWDLVFILDENGKYYEELTEQENIELNHRKIAFDKLTKYLQ